ncbi:hypothetical protein RSAG8_13703, partial [Rhizoctonia solani AG-8 WAC10335]
MSSSEDEHHVNVLEIKDDNEDDDEGEDEGDEVDLVHHSVLKYFDTAAQDAGYAKSYQESIEAEEKGSS